MAALLPPGKCYCGAQNVRAAFPTKMTEATIEIQCPYCGEKHTHGISHSKFNYRSVHCRSYEFFDKSYCIHLLFNDETDDGPTGGTGR
jgi:hypothetical protein